MGARDLLACPFCGDPMRFAAVDVIQHVEQGDCPIGVYAWGGTAKTIERWNTRTSAAPALVEALEAIVSPTGFKNLDAGGHGTHGMALAALAQARARS